MAKAKFEIISAALVPASVVGKKGDDVTLLASPEPISLDEAYGDNLAAHGLARRFVEVKAEKSSVADKKAEVAALKALNDAEKAVSDAEKAFTEAGDDDAKAAAQALLDAAKADLAALLG